jgi:hypothetical protein
MEEYYMTRPGVEPAVALGPTHTNATSTGTTVESAMSEFDRFRLGRIMRDNEEGWAPELRRYLKELPVDVTKDTDIIEWWQVWLFFSIMYYIESSYL